MCGIAGVFALNEGFQLSSRLDELKKMPEKLSHRGPESLKCWQDSQVFLSQTRLKIIDLSSEADPPMFNETGTIVSIFNGEIYNYQELRKELQQKGHKFLTNGDSEVIVHLYEEKADRFASYLDGMFSICIWDQRAHRMTLARDRTGKKPLFYTATPSFFAFASEIKALFPLRDIRFDINNPLLPYYFIYGTIPTPHTVYKNIFSLEPGHLLILEADIPPIKKKYWYPEIYFSQNNHAIQKPEAMEKVRELLRTAVSKRLLSDVPLGAFLSGGIDSSIICGIVTQELNRPLKTFSIGFEGDPHRDETAYARAVAAHFGTQHREFHLNPKDVPAWIDQLVWHHDGPFADTSSVPTAMISELAKKEVTVALTGDGGDEIFAGYNRFLASYYMGKLPDFFWSIGERTFFPLFEGLLSHRHPWGQTARRLRQACRLSTENRLIHWTSFFYDDLSQLLRPEFLKASHIDKHFHHTPHLPETRQMSSLSKLLYLNLKTYLPDDLHIKMDRASMRVALETRSPFLDHSLIEFCATLPSHFLIHRGNKKHLLKETYKDLLPEHVYKRGKLGFDAPLGKWFRGPLKSFIQEELRVLTPIGDYVNPNYVKEILDAHMRGHDLSQKIWNLLMFKKWITLLPTWTT